MNRRSLVFVAMLSMVLLSLAPFGRGYAAPLQPVGFQASKGPLLCSLANPNFSTFPVINLNFRMLDANLMPVVPSDGDLRFSENGNVPVPVSGGVQRNLTDIGINFYVAADKGNRSPQESVRKVLQDLAGYYNEQSDTIKVYNNPKNISTVSHPGTDARSFAQFAAEYPIDKDSQPRQVKGILDEILTAVEKSSDPCQNPRVIIMIAGDDALEKKWILDYGKRIKDSGSKLIIFHLQSERGEFASRDVYSEFANYAGGIYKQVFSAETDIRSVLDQIVLYRQSFSVSYRTNYGQTGMHNIAVFYQGGNIPVQGSSAYQIDIRPPRISLMGPTWVERLRTDDFETQTSTYSIDSETYTVSITWDDAYPRDINDMAKLIVDEDGKPPQEFEIFLQGQGDGTYAFTWNFSDRAEIQRTKIGLSVIAADEFGNIGTSDSIGIDFHVVPTTVTVDDGWKYLVYGLGAAVFLLVALIVVSWIFFRTQMRSIAARGGAMVGKIAGEIRKTLVGGGQRGKPLATLKVLEGPPTMIGQELKVFAESVKLGRNPQLADMTFYGPDILTSVSGLHAKLEKVNGGWRIVALSESRSETFIDDQPLNFHEPSPISDGQKIRMGYPAQQPVILIFSSAPNDSPRKTQVGSDDPRRTDVSMPDLNEKTKPGLYKPVSKKSTSKDSDSVFDEFRN